MKYTLHFYYLYGYPGLLWLYALTTLRDKDEFHETEGRNPFLLMTMKTPKAKQIRFHQIGDPVAFY